jgi:hypothetical protein
MAWLGEELEEKPEGALAPRCVKDVIEDELDDATNEAVLLIHWTGGRHTQVVSAALTPHS